MQYSMLKKNLKHIFLDLDHMIEQAKSHLLHAYKDFSKSEFAAIIMALALTMVTCGMGIINHYVLHYLVDFPLTQLLQSYAYLFTTYIACAIRRAHRRTGQCLLNISLWLLLVSSMYLVCYACLTTPFPTVTAHIANFDELFNINQIAWMQYVQQHAWLHSLLQHSYASLPILLLGTMIILLATGQYQEATNLVNANLIAAIVGVSIFFYFPSLPPAAVWHHAAHFPADTYLIIQRYYAIHHHIAFDKPVQGLIPFPSFHVIWSCISVLALRKQRWAYALSSLIALFIIASTVLLGWHYVADVLAGIVIAGVSYAAAMPLPTPNHQTTTDGA